MSWWLLALIASGLALALAVRRRELARMRENLGEIARAKERGSDKARLQYPHIDLSRCIGCGACVEACPEDGVLALVHGQALVAHGARCVGHGRCAVACPVGAIALTLGDVSQRRDLPVVTDALEVDGQPGVFLAGEVTGYALVRTAIGHGTAVADEVARRAKSLRANPDELDLVIVGAGPAGIACALQAKARGLAFIVLEQEELGGTVAKYPRRKLVLMQPVELPLHGRLDRASYSKEELIELWRHVAAKHELPVRTGQVFVGLARRDDGVYVVKTASDEFAARHVCLALGRRGTPNKLGVAGEELSKVAYSLLDAQSYTGRRILVVGGGDSAIEAALGLAEQPGNAVTLSYRRDAFSRLKARNETRLMDALASGRLTAVMSSDVARIGANDVELRVGHAGDARALTLPNDEVFIFAGGKPPFELLESCGVSFDPERRKAATPAVERGSGLTLALALAFAVAVGAWSVAFASYYRAAPAERALSAWHALLRPSGSLGLALGIGAAVLIACNLSYLARRATWSRFEWGSLRAWMTSHVVTGIGALLLAIAHSAFDPRHTVGGHAFAALTVLVVTGAIGRYVYAFVPRAANGRELALEEVRAKLAALTASWERENRSFGERVRCEIQALVLAGHWKSSFAQRWRALFSSQHALSRVLERVREEGRREGIPDDQLRELLALARNAHRTALAAAHYEDLRALLASWRYLHRWVALLMVFLLVLHVVVALRFGGLGGSGP